MVRSMYSGVVGMRAQQSAMDTIGNNIANVKTYGYKASRTTFKDVYYQTLKNGSAATGNRGGTNPSQIGYGAQLGSIDVLHGQSSFAMTGRSMDMAIAGEGFFQVMDGDGNTFYTRAGQTTFDPEGNLVDSNGNFVLGVSGDPLGRGGSSDRIQLSIPPVNPAAAGANETINSKTLTVKASNPNETGNVSFSFQSEAMTSGMPCKAIITGGGTGITVKLNSNYTFGSMTDLQAAINDAIKEANGGKAHPAGDFSFEFSQPFPAGGLTGEKIVSKDYSVDLGKMTGTFPANFLGGVDFDSVGTGFTGNGAVKFDKLIKVPGTPAKWKFSVTTTEAAVPNTVRTYEGEIDENQKNAGTFLLKNTAAGADSTDTMILKHPGFAALNALDPTNSNEIIPPAHAGLSLSPSTPSENLGFGSKAIKLTGGTEGGTQTLANLESIVVSSDGVITAKHAVHGEIPVGRIDLVTFANPAGLIQAGNTYFQMGPNAGVANYCQPGTNGAGELVTGSLEQSSVDLSQEFSDMITTQRAYQANSRMITVSDTMLEELVNLKR